MVRPAAGRRSSRGARRISVARETYVRDRWLNAVPPPSRSIAPRRPSDPPLDPPSSRTGQKSPAPQKREAREVASVAALTAPVLAALPAHATESLFAVADLSDGVVDEESALYALVGGSLAICTAGLSRVIGSNLVIKNIVNK